MIPIVYHISDISPMEHLSLKSRDLDELVASPFMINNVLSIRIRADSTETYLFLPKTKPNYRPLEINKLK